MGSWKYQTPDFAPINLSQERTTRDLKMSALLEFVRECEAYFDNRADVDDGIPNEAMNMLTEARRVIRLIEGRE